MGGHRIPVDIRHLRDYNLPMRPDPVGICPRVDLVFKEILSNRERLLDFLNAVLAPQKIVEVSLLNAEVTPELLDQKTIVLDVRAEDSSGRRFQVEMQCWLHRALRERMLYSWALLYQNQLPAGEDYPKLQPAISIWLLDQSLWMDDRVHHCFELLDMRSGTRLTDHLRIHCFELDKVRSRRQGDSSPLSAWLHFFAEGESWAMVPDSYRSPSLEAAMSVLERYRNNQHDYEVYRAREEWLRVQATLVRDKQEAEERLARAQQILVQAQQQAEQAQRQAEQAQQQAEQAQLQAEQTQQLLAQERTAHEQERVAREQAEAKIRLLMNRFGLPPGE